MVGRSVALGSTRGDDCARLLARWPFFVAVSALTVVIVGWGTFVLLFSLPTSCSTPIEQIQAARRSGLPILLLAVMGVLATFAALTALGRSTTGRWMMRWVVLGVVAASPLGLLLYHAATDPGFWNSNAFCF